MKRPHLIMAALGLFVLASSSQVVAEPAQAYSSSDDNNSVSNAAIKAGTRTASLSAVDFGDDEVVAYSQSAQTLNGTATLSVNDMSGSGAGWLVTVQASDFMWARGAGNATTAGPIPASAFTIGSTGEVSVKTDGGQSWSDAPAIVSPTALSNAVSLLTAEKVSGQGWYTMPVTVSLVVPAASRAGIYTSTLTTTLSVSP